MIRRRLRHAADDRLENDARALFLAVMNMRARLDEIDELAHTAVGENPPTGELANHVYGAYRRSEESLDIALTDLVKHLPID